MKANFVKIIGLTGVALIALVAGCAGSPTTGTGDQGRLVIQNQSGIELAVYVNKRYERTAKTGDQLEIVVDHVENVGTIFTIEFFYRDRVPSLNTFPADASAKYISFVDTVRPLNSPEPVVPIVVPPLTAEELANNAGVDSVLVEFSYSDYPRVASAVSVFTGSANIQNPIVRLNNGQKMKVPMSIGLTPISIEYLVGGGRDIQRKIYPQNANQRNDDRFVVYVPSDVTESVHTIPLISDIFNISYVSNNPATRGTLRIRNDSSQQINIRFASGSASERFINGNDSVVQRNRRRDFPIDNGEYTLRAVDALSGGYTEIARIDDILIEPGMVYYWFIREQNSSMDPRINMGASQTIKNWFQTWTIDAIANAKISLQIRSTTADVRNDSRVLGVTGRNGQLILRDLDIENLIRGLTTDNARRITLTITAEAEGYESASQSISAYSLLSTGTEFKPERFSLEKINTSIENSEIIIGEPKIQ
jgi:hypothetical protein